MDLKYYLTNQMALHPFMRAADVVKMCYQAAYGAEHLLINRDAAYKYLEKEFSHIDTDGKDLIENISDGVCRVDLRVWKRSGMPIEWLFELFAASAVPVQGAEQVFPDHLEQAREVVDSGFGAITSSEFSEFLDRYKASGMGPIHHSELYREREAPAYRIIDRSFVYLLPVLEAIFRKREEGRICVIAIDGRAASGKSTLASRLSTIIGASVVYVDDFFLPANLRTEKRFEVPGQNVHYERFSEEVLPFIRCKDGFSYGVFDCGIMDISENRQIEARDYIIVEGSYALHPHFGDYADVRVFCTVDPEEQRRRITNRNTEYIANMFFDRWIPMEEQYFEYYGIEGQADVVVDIGKIS